MDKFLQQLADRLQVPDSEIITTDETKDWLDGKLDELVEMGVLVEVEHAKGLVCSECEENCFIEPNIRTNPDTGAAAGVFVCTRNPDIGRIEVDLNRLKQWKIDKKKLAKLGYGTKIAAHGRTNRKQRKQNEKLQMRAALLTHHGFDSDIFSYEPAAQKQLQKLTQWNQPKIHRVMKCIFGDNPMQAYKQRCRQKTIVGFLKKCDDGSCNVEAVYCSNEK